MDDETAATPPVTPAAAQAAKRLTPQEWEQIVILWEAGGATLSDLSLRFGITKPSLSEGLKKRGAVKGCRAKEFARATEESLKSEAQRQGEKIRDFKNKFQTYGDYIMQSAIIELQNIRSKKPEERTREQQARIMTQIKYASEIYANVRDQKFHLFDLYNDHIPDDELPDIGVTEYTPEEIEAIKNRTEMPLLEEDDEILRKANEALGGLVDGEGEPEAA